MVHAGLCGGVTALNTDGSPVTIESPHYSSYGYYEVGESCNWQFKVHNIHKYVNVILAWRINCSHIIECHTCLKANDDIRSLATRCRLASRSACSSSTTSKCTVATATPASTGSRSSTRPTRTRKVRASAVARRCSKKSSASGTR